MIIRVAYARTEFALGAAVIYRDRGRQVNLTVSVCMLTAILAWLQKGSRPKTGPKEETAVTQYASP